MPPELSVIIPTLDDEAALSALLADLATQRGISPEVIVADAGSCDASPPPENLKFRRISCTAGRGRQMNVGARLASASDLLFLHADSRLADPDALRRAKDAFDADRLRHGDAIAGHFSVEFLEARGHRKAFYFYESKARSNRPETINGDQGLLLSGRFFTALGGFDERLPYLEDARLARRVFAEGRWLLLPATIGSSARRFSTEGFWKRQALNALLRNFDAIGRGDFFIDAGNLYRAQSQARALRLAPFLRLAHRVTLSGGLAGWRRTWANTGGYVRDNAWQLAFVLDCGRNFRRGLPPGQGTFAARRAFDAVAPLLGGRAGRFLAALAAMKVFYLLWAILALFERETDNDS